ncbi:MAG TPA: copper homeostasis protein CutC [Terracidiphilus sp.]|nr:copper homeostasis protein CutC [Terracidiphilus sp.]
MRSLVFEVCVDSVASARAAAAGGAHRIELCSSLEVGGLTPPADLLRAVRDEVSIPIFAMVRPRPGHFVCSPAELDQMYAQIAQCAALGANGVVLGVLTPDGKIDVPAVRALVTAARPMQVTFHRAFDVSSSLERSLDQIIEAGADRILTSGAAPNASEASHRIARLVEQAQGRVNIMAGGGVRSSNVRDLVLATGVCEVHTSLGFGDGDGTPTASSRNGASHTPAPFVVRESDVRAMRNLLADLDACNTLHPAVR